MPSPALLCCCLVLLAGVGASRHQSTLPEDDCTHFPASLPHMLRELRAAFGRVKTFFQMKDKLDNILLTGSLLEDFKSYLGCQALSEMIQFYLEEVMPRAENHDPDIKNHVNSLGEKLKTLRLRLRRCVSAEFFPCGWWLPGLPEPPLRARAGRQRLQLHRLLIALSKRGVGEAARHLHVCKQLSCYL
uniref:Interleukin family protein n=3 Tax=Canis lupus familiaris TaxID=9615 RepID=A0A8I3MNZ8_CANLF